MSECDRIGEQMRKAFEGGAWYGPALMEVLQGVDIRTAAARPIEGAHTIWEIVMHIIYGQGVVLRRVRGEDAAWEASEDWKGPPEPTAEAWQGTLDELRRREAELWAAVSRLPDSALDQPSADRSGSLYNNLQGHAQHHAYHAAQIGLLKRAAAPRVSDF